MILLRGLDTAAAALIIVFGALLLTGYIASDANGGDSIHARDEPKVHSPTVLYTGG